MWKLKPADKVIDLVSDSEDEADKKEHQIELSVPVNPTPKKARSRRVTGKQTMAKSEPEHSDRPVPSTKRGYTMHRDKWAAHEGHGLCRGLDGPCIMGLHGAAATAGPSGWCDICNLSDLKELHEHGEGRLTHLLLQLAEPEATLALERIEQQDAGIANDLRARIRRARQRKSAARVKRGPRGPYKKKSIK